MVALLKVFVPFLHNVPVSPFEGFFDTPLHAMIFTVVAMVAGGVREELQRGFLLHRFDQSLGGMKVGLAVFSVVFGLAHYTQGWDVAVATGLLGLFWGLPVHEARIGRRIDGQPRRIQRNASAATDGRQDADAVKIKDEIKSIQRGGPWGAVGKDKNKPRYSKIKNVVREPKPEVLIFE